MKTSEEFKEYFDQRILPDLKPLEEKRKLSSRKIKQLLLISLLLAVAVLTAMGLLRVNPLYMVLTFFGFVVAVVVKSFQLSGRFEKELKRVLLERTLSFLYPDL